MTFKQIIVDIAVTYVVIKGIKIYGDVREQIGVVKGSIATASYIEGKESNK